VDVKILATQVLMRLRDRWAGPGQDPDLARDRRHGCDLHLLLDEYIDPARSIMLVTLAVLISATTSWRVRTCWRSRS
jgi:hypothetical protein